MLQERRSYQEEGKRKRFNSLTHDSDAQRDRARIIHSAAFRRLQAKTQVLGVGESDFYRTRLTHSLEVAQIGSGICESLREKYENHEEYQKWIPSLSQIEAICLGHDLGHPPFGHGGEVALNYYMNERGGFEGNGQTLRIVSKLGEYSPCHGIDLTRRTTLGLLKYPSVHDDVANYDKENSIGKRNIERFKPPKCIHNDEKDVLDWVLKPFHSEEKSKFIEIRSNERGHSKSIHKSFDTSIMEFADDIAYGVHDLEDAIALQLISIQQWQKGVVEKLGASSLIYQDLDFFTTKLFSEVNKDRKHAISKIVAYLISSIFIAEKSEFETPLFRYQAKMDAEAQELLNLLKKFVYETVIQRPEIQILEYKGQQSIMSLFEVLHDNPKRLLPRSTYERYAATGKEARVISDYLSGMTDSYATKLYHKLFSPSIGSIFDRM